MIRCENLLIERPANLWLSLGQFAPAFTRNYLLRAPFFRPPAATPEHGWRLPGTVSRRRSRFIADALISAYLRSLVDGWLDSGRQRDGSEWPTRRNIHQAREAWQAVSEFLEQCPPQLMLSADSGVDFVIAAPDWRRPWAEDFFQAQQIEARRLLVGVLASEWRDGFCKCRYPRCGRYFVRPKLRPQYRHGTFCSAAHRQQASAEALTKRRRREATRYLIEATARWLCQQNVSEWQANLRLKNRLLALLAKEVHRKPNLRPGRQPVQMNWITRNSLAIEKRRLGLLGPAKMAAAMSFNKHRDSLNPFACAVSAWLTVGFEPLIGWSSATRPRFKDIYPPAPDPCWFKIKIEPIESTRYQGVTRPALHTPAPLMGWRCFRV